MADGSGGFLPVTFSPHVVNLHHRRSGVHENGKRTALAGRPVARAVLLLYIERVATIPQWVGGDVAGRGGLGCAAGEVALIQLVAVGAIAVRPNTCSIQFNSPISHYITLPAVP